MNILFFQVCSLWLIDNTCMAHTAMQSDFDFYTDADVPADAGS